MRRPFLIGLLAFGTVAGYASGFHALRYGCHHGCDRGSWGEPRSADFGMPPPAPVIVAPAPAPAPAQALVIPIVINPGSSATAQPIIVTLPAQAFAATPTVAPAAAQAIAIVPTPASH